MNFDDLFIDNHKLPQPLNKDEIYDLFIRLKNGDKKAREKIIMHNIRLVKGQVLTKFYKVNDELQKDLMSEGLCGLINAVDNFDVSKNVKFSTFATYYIDGRILNFLRDNKENNSIISINDIIYKGKKDEVLTREDLIFDEENFEDKMLDNCVYKIIIELVNSLVPRDREIILMYFGFYSDVNYTQQQIADKFNISQNTVSSIISRKLEWFKRKLILEGIIDKKSNQKVKKISR